MKHPSRRTALQATALLSALSSIGLLGTSSASASTDPFKAKSVAEALKAMGAEPATSADIQLQSPDIAENGAVVQVSISSSLPKTEEIHLLVEKNPFPLVASTVVPDGTDAFVQLRAKMGQTTTVWALVKADGRWFTASKETKVTLGGCGG
jgi:sulfur-oxidizing protein SoxY